MSGLGNALGLYKRPIGGWGHEFAASSAWLFVLFQSHLSAGCNTGRGLYLIGAKVTS